MSVEPPELPPPPPVFPPERPLAAPNPLRTWGWTGLRLLLVQLPLSYLVVACAWVSYTSFAEAAGQGLRMAALSGLAGLLLTVLDWLSARRTWRVFRGWEPTPSIEPLVYTAAVLGVGGLAAGLAVVKFSEMMRSPNEGATRGNLGAIRSALSIYYGDMEGLYPEDLRALTVNGKYIAAFSTARTPPYHKESARVHMAPAPDDTGGWWYGTVRPKEWVPEVLGVNCTHTDVRGKAWTSY